MKSEWCKCGHHFEDHGWMQFCRMGAKLGEGKLRNGSRTNFNCSWHPPDAKFQCGWIKQDKVMIPYMGYGHWCDCDDFIPLD